MLKPPEDPEPPTPYECCQVMLGTAEAGGCVDVAFGDGTPGGDGEAVWSVVCCEWSTSLSRGIGKVIGAI